MECVLTDVFSASQALDVETTFQNFLKLADDFPQKPGAAFGLIDPVFNQAGRGHIIVLFADLMRGAQESRKVAIVGMDLSKHILRADGFLVVVFQTLVLCDIADRAKRCASELARALGNIVRQVEDLFSVLIEQKVIIAKMPPRHVPMKILRLDVQRECVCEQGSEFGCDFRHTFAAETARNFGSAIMFGFCLNRTRTIFRHVWALLWSSCIGCPISSIRLQNFRSKAFRPPALLC
jgi:hypothetical protein